MHHICNFVGLGFNKNENTTLKIEQKTLQNKKNTKHVFKLL